MSVKEDFSSEEWRTLLRAPMLVGYAIMGAAPSKEEGIMREMKAVADAVVYSGDVATIDSLVGAVSNEIKSNATDQTVGAREVVPVGEMPGRALDVCRQVAAILQTKVSADEAESYKRWLVAVAQNVADASKEGGILGFGGAQVSDKEASLLQEISASLGVE